MMECGKVAVAIARKDFADGRIGYQSVIGRFMGKTIAKDGEEYVLFRNCACASRISDPIELKHSKRMRYKLRSADIFIFQTLEDISC